MTQPSSKYLDKVERWILGGVSIQQMVMSADQKFRSMLAYEAYQIWLQNKQIKPTDIMRRLAAREYPLLLKRAEEGNIEAQEYVKALRVRPGVPRTISEISNDVAVFNWIVGKFNTPIENIEKAKVVDASDWLITQGMKRGDAKAVKSGADIKMQLNNNFQDKDNPAEQMPTTEFNITGDVSVVKNVVNYSDEEKRRIARKFGLTDKQVTEMIQNSDGTWVMPDEEEKDKSEKDVFERNEEELLP